ncbi:M20/M25/M40 family metallo-hydrolase [Plantibacter flavus]|uniref:M20/M25/M40 family metallo-hydrolase n=1 Tax=Plantibacter flavus TaxID=150123 RepID=UPI003F16C6B5
MSVENLGDDALDLACQLIAVDSVNPGLVPGSAGEAEIAALIGERLERAGCSVQYVPGSTDPRRVSVIAVHRGQRPGRTIVLNGHLDTVGVEGMVDPFKPYVTDGRLYGRGASDMKSGLAGLIVAAEHLARTDHPGTIVFTGVADEEDESVGVPAVLARLTESGTTADLCLIAEPSWLNTVSAHRGYAVVEVTLQGAAAHSSQPDLGVDAVRALGTLLNEVERADHALQKQPEHPLLGFGSFRATVVRAGTAPFTLAAEATVTIERRTLPGERAEHAEREVRDMLAAVTARTPGVQARVSLTHHRQAWAADARGPASRFRALLTARIAEGTGRRPEATGAPYWMESVLWQEAGVPAVVCGPAGGGLHAAVEWADVDQVRQFPVAVAAAIRDYLEAPSTRE